MLRVLLFIRFPFSASHASSSSASHYVCSCASVASFAKTPAAGLRNAAMDLFCKLMIRIVRSAVSEIRNKRAPKRTL